MSTTKKYIEGFTRQIGDALKISQSLDLARPGSDIRNMIIAGMGGSGIVANLVESLTFGKIPTSPGVWKAYSYPIIVDGSKIEKDFPEFKYQKDIQQAYKNYCKRRTTC